jgi:putative IMPACT (imprinted ancient) family translation regulator
LALAAAPRPEVWRLATLELEIAFEQIGPVESLLAKQGTAVHAITREFGEWPRFRVVVRWSRVEKLRADLVEATRGRIRVSATG